MESPLRGGIRMRPELDCITALNQGKHASPANLYGRRYLGRHAPALASGVGSARPPAARCGKFRRFSAAISMPQIALLCLNTAGAKVIAIPKNKAIQRSMTSQADVQADTSVLAVRIVLLQELRTMSPVAA
jgi:hypothetical protein